MLAFHRRLAEIGLKAIAEFGFVLAGGYAVSANGMGDRRNVLRCDQGDRSMAEAPGR